MKINSFLTGIFIQLKSNLDYIILLLFTLSILILGSFIGKCVHGDQPGVKYYSVIEKLEKEKAYQESGYGDLNQKSNVKERIKIMNVWGAIADGAMKMGQLGLQMYNDKRTRDNIANINAENIAYQKEFAKHGIQWRVEDAKNAGIHPLAAIGAQTTSFTPSLIAGQRDTPNLSVLGSNIKALLNRKELSEQKALDRQHKLAVIRNIDADTLAKTGQGMEFLTSGNRNSSPVKNDAVEIVPAIQTSKMKDAPGIQAGTHAGFRYVSNKLGWHTPLPSQELQELYTELNPQSPRLYMDELNEVTQAVTAYSRYKLPSSKRWREFLKRARPKKMPDGSPMNPNYEWRAGKSGITFKLVRKRDVFDSQFYYTGRGNIPNNNSYTFFSPSNPSPTTKRKIKSREKQNRNTHIKGSKYF